MDDISDVLSLLDAPATVGLMWYFLNRILKGLEKSVSGLSVAVGKLMPAVEQEMRNQQEIIKEMSELKTNVNQLDNRMERESRKTQELLNKSP